MAALVVRTPGPYLASPEKTMEYTQGTFSSRLLSRRRDRLLEELRVLAPDLVEKLELTLKELGRHESDGLESAE